MMMKKLLSLLGFAIVGAVAGLGGGLVLVPPERDRWIIVGAYTVTGALCGTAVAVRLIRGTGFAMIAGGVLGGALAVVHTRIGKSALYGAPLGSLAGLALGLAIEQWRASSRATQPQQPSETHRAGS